MIWEKELEKIKEGGLYRQLQTVEAMSDQGYAMVNGHKMMMFASNNYLGLANDQRLIEASVQATQRFGTGSTGSRLTTGNTIVHEKLEKRLAEFKQTDSAIVLNTGYMANIAALTTLVGKDDLILSDEMNHASIIDGCRLSRAETMIYRHADLLDLEMKLQINTRYRKRIIVTDGVFSMDGDIAPLPGIVELAKRYDALVMVDDAHATGVLGKDGRGTSEHFGLKGKIDIEMGTLSKAVGTEGGYIAGSRSLVDYVLNRARPFVFSTALSAGVVASALTAVDIIQSEPERRVRIRAMSQRLYNELTSLGYTVSGGETPILAIICGEPEQAMFLSKELHKHGIYAPAIRPPTVPSGTSRIRFTLMATHQEEQMNHVIDVFRTIRTNRYK
ncbi:MULTISPECIES: 8-amino-7-oxononanoate synthase [Peribacillus]|uniref:8-amino-7-oxononanoate synthase n=1 Tax=Peribacillus TaxID=2675229 RepID=UPI001914757A|nr:MULTISPECIES: 8-amino-7-oxononanoate synthase [unclassified Peribacillus]MBK5443565.1 8-amino-7-oxononanoate synthase [Peribacillus sp. TH24]MBK5461708.1 8-amino-7-oxononanoate synthase [Peribacillus sp. TH27]MBK5484971.1 8-amino-7-oxononanoate synthase [Peribacillus sp. TH16]MBK5499851.1 8-amino-7-oxononanoate synthase [Peribacillus sp. TH14]WMX55064.1 8-amino-7-oxononanoate synthase [Peribacillus sp. R9-11]